MIFKSVLFSIIFVKNFPYIKLYFLLKKMLDALASTPNVLEFKEALPTSTMYKFKSSIFVSFHLF